MELEHGFLSLALPEPSPLHSKRGPSAVKKQSTGPGSGSSTAAKRRTVTKKQSSPDSSSVAAEIPVFRQQLNTFYDSRTLDLLTPEQQHALHKELKERPLLLALVDLYPPLGLLSFPAYTAAIQTFESKVLPLSEPLFMIAQELAERAAFYEHSNYRLHASEVVIVDTPSRQILKIALEEAGIGFDRRGELNWGLPTLLYERARQNLLSRLPKATPQLIEQANVLNTQRDESKLTSEAKMEFFERIINRPGTWLIKLSDFCTKRNDLTYQGRFLSSLVEDQFLVLNLSAPCCPSVLFQQVNAATRLCLFFCDPVPLSFWSTLAMRFASELRTVIFVFEPTATSIAPLQGLLGGDVPSLNVTLTAGPTSGYCPEFVPSDGLTSPVFLRKEYWQRSFLVHIDEIPFKREDLPPLASIGVNHYAQVIRYFCNMITGGGLCNVKFLTGTWLEAEQIWNDCLQLLGCEWFPNQQVNLSGDPLNSDLVLKEINNEGANCTLQQSEDSQLGTDFILSELRQAYVSPLEMLIHRHYNILFYYSAVRPLTLDSLYRMTAAANQNVLIVAMPEALRLI